MGETIKPILLRYGGAKKSTFEMTEAELQEAAAFIVRRAKEKSFSRGLPIYYSEGNKAFAEYPDGHVEEV